MSAKNDVSILGNLTADPQVTEPEENPKLKQTLARFSVGHNRRYKDQSGELKEEAHFFNVSAWGPAAKYAKRNLSKGNLVLVDGRLDYQSWETDDGKKRSTVAIIADSLQRLEWPKTEAEVL